MSGLNVRFQEACLREIEQTFYRKLHTKSKNRNQFGFNLSTCSILYQLLNYSINDDADDAGNVTVGVFVDLDKAFDTVDHAILLSKFNCYEICGIPQHWFANYLTNYRKQFV